jgi:hypothetical protein
MINGTKRVRWIDGMEWRMGRATAIINPPVDCLSKVGRSGDPDAGEGPYTSIHPDHSHPPRGMMLSPPASPPRLPGYDLREPVEDDALASLRRVFGPERGTERWSQACRTAGLSAGAVRTRVQLVQAVQALAAQGGPSAAVARSVEIRLRTYARLAANAATAGGAP